MAETIRIIDLFAGIGGIRLGVEQAAAAAGYDTRCEFTSEIKPHAIKVLKQNHPGEEITGDITAEENLAKIPEFDILCAGFPCQAFSAAGNRDGFADTRGTMFFYVEKIIKDHRPKGFILENVEGLVNHDGGNTLSVILGNLENLGYATSCRVLNSKNFGVPQERKRIYIVGYNVGTKSKAKKAKKISFDNFPETHNTLASVIESGLPVSDSTFVKRLLELFTIEELSGKAIKDKRGGESNIHSWDLEMKGPVSNEEKKFLNKLMTERRKKKWADKIGIEWMDGMPLTEAYIKEFYNKPGLKKMLNKLTKQGYLRFEHPKTKVYSKHTAPNGTEVVTSRRVPDETKPKGYNIVAGKLSFEVGKVMAPGEIAPTLVATDMQHLYVADGAGIRTLSLREGLGLFGYPKDYKFDIPVSDGYDLLGNTVVVPVIKAVAARLINQIYAKK